jgi:hypothetical protein
MAVLQFPKTRPDGSPLQNGDQYTGENGVLYTYDGVKWIGHSPSVNPGSNSIVNSGFVVQVDSGGNLVIPNSATIIYESGVPVTSNVLVNNSFTVQLSSTGTLNFINTSGYVIDSIITNAGVSQTDLEISANNNLILTTNAATTLSNSWNFLSTGSIVFPDNTVQATAWTGTMVWSQVTGNPPKGYTGSASPGYVGSTGDLGYVGSIGYTGSIGDLGYVGSTGDLGYVGSIGYTGSIGDLGYVGSQGTIGYTGSMPVVSNAFSNSSYSLNYTPVVTGANTRLAITATGNITINTPTSTNDGDVIYFRILSSGGSWQLNVGSYQIPSLETTFSFPVTMTSGLEYHMTVQYSALRGQWQLIQFVGGY